MNLVIVNNMIFYINSINFSTATTVYSDALLNTVATDGYYSYQGYYRRQVNGKLTDVVACPGIVLNPFDYIIVTYEYVPPVGLDYDLDTLTTLRYPGSTLTGDTSSTIAGFIPGTGVVGCGTTASGPNTTIPSGMSINDAYLTFGGDDNAQIVDGSYGESVVINFKNLEDSGILDPTKNIIIAELYAGWHSQEGGFVNYPINIKYETFIGGTITNYILPPIPPGTETNRYISSGTRPDPAAISNPITAIQSGCNIGVTGVNAKRNVAYITYNRTTGAASINFIEY